MPRARNPSRDQALEIYRQHGGKITNREIAAQVGVDEKVIAVWKGRYNWKDVVQQDPKRCTTRRKGGQPGNKNAVGNSGGAPPKRNKNAVKTGEFETLFFDCLDPEERALVARVQPDKEALLLQEIQLLTVREHRMLRRIESLKESAMTEDEDSKSKGMTAVKRKISYDDDAVEYTGVLGQIQAVEDALTRVQARRQKAIEALHRFGFDDARLELETMKFELELSRADTQGKETPNDGFLEALGAEAVNAWGDSDE